MRGGKQRAEPAPEPLEVGANVACECDNGWRMGEVLALPTCGTKIKVRLEGNSLDVCTLFSREQLHALGDVNWRMEFDDHVRYVHGKVAPEQLAHDATQHKTPRARNASTRHAAVEPTPQTPRAPGPKAKPTLRGRDASEVPTTGSAGSPRAKPETPSRDEAARCKQMILACEHLLDRLKVEQLVRNASPRNHLSPYSKEFLRGTVRCGVQVRSNVNQTVT